MHRVAEPRFTQFSAQRLANTAWAFATAGRLVEALLAALAGAVESRHGLGGSPTPRGRLPRRLAEALAKATEPRLGEFNAQDVSNTAWAFAKVGQSGQKLFVALGQAVQSVEES